MQAPPASQVRLAAPLTLLAMPAMVAAAGMDGWRRSARCQPGSGSHSRQPARTAGSKMVRHTLPAAPAGPPTPVCPPRNGPCCLKRRPSCPRPRSPSPPQVGSEAQPHAVELHARLACPARSVQLLAAHATCSLLLAMARRKLMEQLPAGAGAPAAACSAVGSVAVPSSPVLHCSSRLPGSRRAAIGLLAGSAQLQDFSREVGAKARLVEHVVALPPPLAAHPASLEQSAQSGPVLPPGHAAAKRNGKIKGVERRPQGWRNTTLGSQLLRPGHPGKLILPLTVLCEHRWRCKRHQDHQDAHQPGVSTAAARKHSGQRIRLFSLRISSQSHEQR